MNVPARVTGSEEEDAVPSPHRLRSKDTLEIVLVRCGGGSWPEAANGDALASGPAKPVSPVKLRCVAECESRV